jgi:Cu(I)/Ag(I) efflux system membrane fusion protein
VLAQSHRERRPVIFFKDRIIMSHLSSIVRLSLALAVFAGFTLLNPIAGPAAEPGWQPVNAEVTIGKKVRFEVKLAGIDPLPAPADIKVSATRIDMGPDGMETMASPVTALASATPGVLAFETDFSMAGRWAFTITATVKGQAKPVTGKVVFTATEKKSEIAPGKPEAAPGGKRKILYYRNPMGAPDVSKVPKKDSMGMDYIPVYEDETTGPQGSVRLAPEKVQRAGVRLASAHKQTVTRTVRATGTIVPDEARLGVVTAKFNGFVEELFVATSGERVHKGQPLMRVWIESPEILQRQADLFLTPVSERGTADQSVRNLQLFGLSRESINEIHAAGRPLRSITFHAPRDGTVMVKPALVGMRFATGETLFRVADLSTVWAMVQVAERDIGLLREGQKADVTLKAYPDAPITGTVAFVYPELDAATRTVPVRIVLPNPEGLLRAGLYADVAIATTGAADVIAIPESAVIDSGTRKVAFVAKGEGLFEARNLVLGARGGGMVEVREGIADGEEIVVSGNFLIDAESNLRAALAAFAPPEPAK